MNQDEIKNYATLLTTYCCQIQSGQKILIRSTYLAESLVLACQKEILSMGALCEVDISLPNYAKQKYEYSDNEQLNNIPTLYEIAVNTFDAIIVISAPYNLYELKGIDEDKVALQQEALKPIKQKMMQRSSKEELKWVICNFPTESLANAANMSLNEYDKFISDNFVKND